MSEKILPIDQVVTGDKATDDDISSYGDAYDENTGDDNTGNWNSGNDNTGNGNSGENNDGDLNTGDNNTGKQNTGDGNNGNWNSGDDNTGNWNVGDENTGDLNTGDGNNGSWNSGNWNTGDCNTGNENTGDGNTGDGNATNRQTGYLCMEEPPLVIFDEPVRSAFVDWELVEALARIMASDEPIENVEQYLDIPNATVKKIQALHQAHIDGRKQAGGAA